MSHSEKKTKCLNTIDLNKTLDTKQLFKALIINKTTRGFFDGVYAKDLLENIESPPELIICNTDDSDKKGEHWLAFFFHNEICEFYDPLGKSYSYYGPEFINFVNKFSVSCISTKKRTQPLNSSLCGLYCLYFAYFKCQGKKFSTIIQSMSSKQRVFKTVKKLFRICRQCESKFIMSCSKK
jgi:hypothetical protein